VNVLQFLADALNLHTPILQGGDIPILLDKLCSGLLELVKG
jgi:hypothetical protein